MRAPPGQAAGMPCARLQGEPGGGESSSLRGQGPDAPTTQGGTRSNPGTSGTATTTGFDEDRPTSTLIPQANPAKPRVVAVERVSLPVPTKGKKKKGTKAGARAPEPKPAVEQHPPPQQAAKAARASPSWAEVTSRGARRRARNQLQASQGKDGSGETKSAPPPVQPSVRPGPPKPKRTPKMAAVTIIYPPRTYEATMREARANIDLEGLGIKGVRVRRAITWTLIYEIPGDQSQARADLLALRLRQTLSGKEGVKVQRPVKMAELRLRGLNVAVSASEVRAAVAVAGRCEEEEMSVGDLKRAPNGTEVVWIRCPLTAANQPSLQGPLRVRLALARDERLNDCPLQCYKYLEGGHVRTRCPNNVDRSGKCYRCGQEGHMAGACTAPAHCVVCADRGLPSNHRTGGRVCAPMQKGKRGVPLDKMGRPASRTGADARGTPQHRGPLPPRGGCRPPRH